MRGSGRVDELVNIAYYRLTEERALILVEIKNTATPGWYPIEVFPIKRIHLIVIGEEPNS